MRDTFCALPFTHLALLPDGTAKMCCMAAGRVTEGGVPMSVERQPLDGIWNSAYLAETRERMLSGREVRDCEACYRAEDATGASYRTSSNERWLQELDITAETLRNRARPSEPISSRPISWQLMPGNACNLKCRMCSPLFSSRIASDRVHAAWSRRLVAAESRLDWGRERVTIAPGGFVDVVAQGVHATEPYEGGTLQWTDGRARWRLDIPIGIRCLTLVVRFWPSQRPAHPIEMRINGVVVFSGKAPRRAELEVPLPDAARLDIEIESASFKPANDARVLGVAIRELAIVHQPAGDKATPHALAARVARAPWFADDAWMDRELLRNEGTLRWLYITGGEPMVIPQVARLLEGLATRGIARHVSLELNSNGTVDIPARIEPMLAFKRVALSISIDGFGAVNEYIRFPSRWQDVAEKLLRLHRMHADLIQVSVIAILQAYNALQVTDLLRFLDGHGIHYTVELATDPQAISLAAMPGEVRALCAARLRDHAGTLPESARRKNLESIAATIDAMPVDANPALLEDFHRFTEDLDRSRGQRFDVACSELARLLGAKGPSGADGGRPSTEKGMMT